MILFTGGVLSQHALQQVSRGVLSQHALQVVSQHALQQVSRGVPAPGGGGSAPGGICSRGGSAPGGVPGGPPGTSTAAGGTHPTGMHSCLECGFTVLLVSIESLLLFCTDQYKKILTIPKLS